MENNSSQQHVNLRKKTRAVAQFQTTQLQEYLADLTPLTRPSALLGDFVDGGAKGTSQIIGKAVSDFTSVYHQVAGAKPFSDEGELKAPLEVGSTHIEIYPFQYRHTVAGAEGKKVVTVVSPLKWTLNYQGYALGGLRSALAQRDAPRELVRRFLIHTVLLNFMVTHQAGFNKILEGLRYQVSATTLQEFGNLPVTCIAFIVPTVRPSDEVILETTEFSGVDQVEEVLDLDAVSNLRDPLRERLVEALDGSGNGSPAAA